MFDTPKVIRSIGTIAVVAAGLVLLAWSGSLPLAATGTAPQDGKGTAAVVAGYGKLPLIFEANRGQTDARVKFLSRGPGYTLFLTPGEAVLSLRGADGKGHALRVKLLGAEAEPKMTGLDRLLGISNYFIGRDRSKWQTGVPHYAKVGYEGVYPGIDLVFYGTNQRQLEYDFTVAPGADPGAIQLGLEGAEGLEIDPTGNLVAHLPGGEVRFLKPVIYQEANGKRRSIKGKYTLAEGNRIGFEIAAYDRTKPLVIDPVLEPVLKPVLEYSTFLGGNSYDSGRDIAVDVYGNAYVTGGTYSPDFPVTDLTEYSGSAPDVYVAKLTPDGKGLFYSTFLGGNSIDNIGGIVLDGAGNAYVTGDTSSSDFPTTSNAFQPSCEVNKDGVCINESFLTKFDPDGEIVYSTYLGGGSYNRVSVKPGCPSAPESNCLIYVTGGGFLKVLDPGTAGPAGLVSQGTLPPDSPVSGMAVDGSGAAYITGWTTRNDFPTTLNAMDTNCAHDEVDDDCGGGFGGGAFDAFVTVLRPNDEGGFELVYSTYLGGALSALGRDIAVMPGCFSDCWAFVTGWTNSVDFPTTASALLDGHTGSHRDADTFVMVIDTADDGISGNDLVYSTLFGGEEGMGIAADDAGRAYVTGSVRDGSPGVPIRDAIQPAIAGHLDLFAAVIDTKESGAKSLLFSTYLGGVTQDTGLSIAADVVGDAYVIGQTNSEDFPATAGAFQEGLAFSEATTRRGPFKPSKQEPKPTMDAFVLKIAGPFEGAGAITQVDVPSRPAAVDDLSYATGEDAPLTVSAAAGVLGNDVDPENDTLTAILVRTALNGTVEHPNPDKPNELLPGLAMDGSFVYTPNPDFTGRDHFAYAAFDGQAESNVAVAVIDVEPANDPPVAVNDIYRVIVGETLKVAAPGVLSNDTDDDSSGLTATLEPGTGPTLGTLDTFKPDGSFTYTAPGSIASADVPDFFKYRASDGASFSDTANVQLLVNDGTVHVGDMAPQATKQGRTWFATVTVWFHDSGHRTGFRTTATTIEGTWSGAPGTVGQTYCGTDYCQVNFMDIPGKFSSVTFKLTDVAHSDRFYEAGANHDADGDSDGTTVTVFK